MIKRFIDWFRVCQGKYFFHQWGEAEYVRFGPGRWEDCYKYTCFRCGEEDYINTPEGI